MTMNDADFNNDKVVAFTSLYTRFIYKTLILCKGKHNKYSGPAQESVNKDNVLESTRRHLI